MIQDTIEQTMNRIAFGKPLLHNQVIQFRLAELMTEVELLKSLTYRATGRIFNYIAILHESCLNSFRSLGFGLFTELFQL